MEVPVHNPLAPVRRRVAVGAVAAAALAPGGIVVDGTQLAAGTVVVAAGPWTPALVDPTGGWRPIEPVWGVVVDVLMDDPPRHIVEEAGVEEVAAGGGGLESLFSVVAAEGIASVGSTFLAQEPRASAWAGTLRRAGERFVPGLARGKVDSARACARPQSLDGRPLVGRAGGVEGLWIAAGHGPWGISTGPGTGSLVAAALLGAADPPAALDPARFRAALPG
jgi:glycine/D-amino acid oxidase-like deaminating enzyme